MAMWDRITSRGDVEDRRSFGPVAGALGIGGILVVVALNFLTGGNLNDALNQVQSLQIPSNQTSNSEYEGEDAYQTFASTVVGSTNDMWVNTFKTLGKTYSSPKLILFRTSTESACGLATSDVGPHYCPLDNHIYLDETFFDELENYLGATGGDVAEAYVIAHEVGHHVQNQLGILDNASNSQQASINIELQADCYAGLWLNSIKDQNVLLPNEINEALDAASAVGDNHVQEKTTGQVNPETWTHGSSEQRVQWFNKGYIDGTFSACNI